MLHSGLTAPLALILVLVAQQGSRQALPEKTVELGTITGHVETPAGTGITGQMQVVLLSPYWVNLWNGEVQKRLDVYFDRYRQAFARSGEFPEKASSLAHRDAIVFVIGRMQRDLGEEFTKLVKTVSPAGRFEFDKLPQGEYTVIVVAAAGGSNLIWAESLQVSSPIPQFIEVRTRIQ